MYTAQVNHVFSDSVKETTTSGLNNLAIPWNAIMRNSKKIEA
jgi:hypothetical protein